MWSPPAPIACEIVTICVFGICRSLLRDRPRAAGLYSSHDGRSRRGTALDETRHSEERMAGRPALSEYAAEYPVLKPRSARSARNGRRWPAGTAVAPLQHPHKHRTGKVGAPMLGRGGGGTWRR